MPGQGQTDVLLKSPAVLIALTDPPTVQGLALMGSSGKR